MTATADALMAIFGFKRVEGKQMKTDRELLELAAKAAGYEVWQGRWHQEDMMFMRLKKQDPTGKCSGREWNPLTDDGDALRLAATLRLTVGDEDQSVRSMAFAYARHRPDIPHSYEPSQRDPAAAYRRAIVRAAAAMCKD